MMNAAMLWWEPEASQRPSSTLLREFKAFRSSESAKIPSLRKTIRLQTVVRLSDDASSREDAEAVRVAFPLLQQIQEISGAELEVHGDALPQISPLVRKEAARYVVNFAELGLRETADGDSIAMPSVHPTAGGGLQFEWHRKGIDLEIEVQPSGRIQAYLEEEHGAQEFDLSNGLNAIEAPLTTVLVR